MLSIVIFTIIIGVAVLSLENALLRPVKLLLSAIQEVCMTVVKWSMLLVPIAVFGLMAQLTSSVGLSSLIRSNLLCWGRLARSIIIGNFLFRTDCTSWKNKPIAFPKKNKGCSIIGLFNHKLCGCDALISTNSRRRTKGGQDH